MIQLWGENYYFDVDELETQVSINSSKIAVPSGDTENEQISVTRYETFKLLMEIVLSEREGVDENLGIHSTKDLSIPFKISFNTLLLNKIIKKF